MAIEDIGIRIDDLNPSSEASLDHVLAAMRGGNSYQLTVAQILSLLGPEFNVVAEQIEAIGVTLSGKANSSEVLRRDQPQNLSAAERRQVLINIGASRFAPFVYGLTLSNNGTVSIDISPGAAQGNGVSIDNPDVFTKNISSLWAKGTGNGGRDAGALAASKTYHAHAILQLLTGDRDFLFSLSATAPSLPEGWVFVERLGSVRTNSSSQVSAFTQNGNTFSHPAQVTDFASTVVRGSAPLVLSVPTGVKTIAKMTVRAIGGSGNVMVVSGSDFECYSATSGTYLSYEIDSLTDVSGAVVVAATGFPNTTNTWQVLTRGWVDFTVPRIGG